MNGIKGKLWIKLTAICVAMLSAAILAISSVAVAIMLENDVFFDGGQRLSEDVWQTSISNKLNDVVLGIESCEPLGDIEALENAEAELLYYLDSEKVKAPATDATLEEKYDWQSEYNESDATLSAYDESSSPVTADEIKQLISMLDMRYNKNASNLSIEIYNSDGELIYNNFTLEDVRLELDRDIAVSKLGSKQNLTMEFYNAEDLNNYVNEYLSSARIDTMDVTEDDNLFVLYVEYYPVYQDSLTVHVSVPTVLETHDDIYVRVAKMESFVANRNLFVVALVISAIIFAVCFIFLISSAGYNERDNGIHLSFFDKIPLELVLCAAAAIIVVCVMFASDFIYYSSISDLWISVVIFMAVVALCAGAVIVILMTIAARCKGGKLFQYTIIIGGIILLYKFLRLLFRNFRYTKKAAVVYGLLLLYDLLNIVAVINGSVDYGISMFFLGRIAVGIGFIVYVAAFGKIKDGCKRISGGDADATIDTERMPAELKNLACDINSIGNGIHLAVDEKMKSERLKTELITNVSHDLKTPLTSIVNYVDILSKEDIKPDTAKEYVDVLVRQSQRMKKLIDDLVEASKASSGAIQVNFERSDMTLLVTQAVTEYEEKLARARLTPVIDVPDKPVPVMIDGRLMWRVLDNLIGNICKYAQPETRVYISEIETDKTVTVVFKNISKYALNISSEELMERFVRGDSSRSTEGSGLGLSIARGLCNLQNVKFGISIDGDLFKAELSLNKLPEDPDQPDMPHNTEPEYSEHVEPQSGHTVQDTQYTEDQARCAAGSQFHAETTSRNEQKPDF